MFKQRVYTGTSSIRLQRRLTWHEMRLVWPAVQMGALPEGPSFEKSHTVLREPPCKTRATQLRSAEP